MTTSPVTTSPVTTSPVTTSPAPLPDTSGPWRLDGMSPRVASTSGGTVVTLTGRFPTTVPVAVWFGDLGTVDAVSTGNTLTVRTPAVLRAGVTDVVVKFRTTANNTLTLTAAFTFVAPTPPTTTPTTTTPTTTPRTTVPTPTPTTTPGSPPTSAAPGTTSPGTTSPGTTSPGTTSPGTTLPRLGNLTLRAKPSTGAMSRLSAFSWPRPGCRSSSCPATSL